MTIFRHEWSLSMTLTAPFKTNGSDSAGIDIDTSLLRDADGRLILSGSQLLGRFRHFLLAIFRAQLDAKVEEAKWSVKRQWLMEWFGLPGRQLRKGSDLENLDVFALLDLPMPVDVDDSGGRASLSIRDLPISTKQDSLELYSRARIALDPISGAVEQGSFQIIEQYHRAGEVVLFQSPNSTATVILYATVEDGEHFSKFFQMFLDNIIAIGGNKAQGYGRCKHAKLDRLQCVELQLKGVAENSITSPLVLKFRFDSPIVVDPAFLSGNLHRSADVIPGSNIKAALAEFGRKASADFDREFGTALAGMRVSHARVIRRGSRGGPQPSVIPFSTVVIRDKGQNDYLKDFYHLRDSDEVCAFPVDFKANHEDRARSMYPAATVSYVSRTRTAIDETIGTSKEHQLFTVQAISHRVDDKDVEFELTLAWDKDHQNQVERLVQFLSSGNVQIGKLRSKLYGVQKDHRRSAALKEEEHRNTWRLVLQTPAYLLNFATLQQLDAGTDLTAIYRDILKAQFTASVQALFQWDKFECLTQHSWSGGQRALRYRQKINGNDEYYPYCITVPGSIFRLHQRGDLSQDENAKISEEMNSLLEWGLLSADHEMGWRHNPFVRENGYGEVSIREVPFRLTGGATFDDA